MGVMFGKDRAHVQIISEQKNARRWKFWLTFVPA